MRLALTELRRAPGRFALPVLALGLVAFLAVALTALAAGTEQGTTGALDNSRTDVIVLASDTDGELERSQLDPALAAQVEAIPGVRSSGVLGVFTGVAEGPDDTFDMALLGFTPGRAGAPENLVDGRLPFPGEDGAAVVDTSLRTAGVSLGSQIIVQGSTRPVQVVGLVTGSRYRTLPAVWTSVSTWQSIVQEARPERGANVQVVVVTVDPDEEPARVADRISTTVPGVTASTTVATLEAVPGGRQQRQIRLWSVPVALLMVAVLTAWIVGTATRGREHLQALRVLGLRDRAIGGGIALQALFVCVGGLLLGGVLVGAATLAVPQELLVTPDLLTTALVVAAITVAALAGAVWAIRHTLREPIVTAVLADVPEQGTTDPPQPAGRTPGSPPTPGSPSVPVRTSEAHGNQPRDEAPGTPTPPPGPASGLLTQGQPPSRTHSDRPRDEAPGTPTPPPGPASEPPVHDQPTSGAGTPSPGAAAEPDDTRWYAGDDPTGEFPGINPPGPLPGDDVVPALPETPPAGTASQRDNERWES